jgi:hypothetical protein
VPNELRKATELNWRSRSVAPPSAQIQRRRRLLLRRQSAMYVRQVNCASAPTSFDERRRARQRSLRLDVVS